MARSIGPVVIILSIALSGLAADWPRFLGPADNGHSAESGLLRAWPKNGPAKLWERSVGSGYAGPAVAGGKLILFHRVENDDVLECLDAKSGDLKWKYSVASGYVDDFGFDDGPRCVPVVVGENVYSVSAEARLTCLQLATGKKVWDRDLAADYPFKKSYFGFGSGPLVDGDRVVVNVGSKGASIVAFNRFNGKEVWKTGDDASSYASPIAADIAGQRRLIFLTREALVILDPNDGTETFRRKFRPKIDASVSASTPLVADGHLFLSASYNTGALLLQIDGWSEVWKNDESLSNHYNTSIKVADHLYGIHGRQETGAALRCVEWKTGKVRWNEARFGCAWLIAADGLLIAAIENGEIALIEPNPDGYRELSRFTAFEKPTKIGKFARSAPALSDGVLYARDATKLTAWKVAK